jgi:hypothetical protein
LFWKIVDSCLQKFVKLSDEFDTILCRQFVNMFLTIGFFLRKWMLLFTSTLHKNKQRNSISWKIRNYKKIRETIWWIRYTSVSTDSSICFLLSGSESTFWLETLQNWSFILCIKMKLQLWVLVKNLLRLLVVIIAKAPRLIFLFLTEIGLNHAYNRIRQWLFHIFQKKLWILWKLIFDNEYNWT